MTKVKPKLKELSGKQFIRLTERGNQAIDKVLELVSKLGMKKVLIADQGGWIHYRKAPCKFNLEIVEVKTDRGLIDVEDLMHKAEPESVFLCNSMPGYSALEDIETIYGVCHEKDCILINDVAGSIGTDVAKIGDIIIGSFGRWKPVNLEYGGFIASDEHEFVKNIGKDEFDVNRKKELLEKLEDLPNRLNKFKETRSKIIKDLKNFEIVHPDREGINVIVAFKSEEEKNKLIEYCTINNYEYTECPRYIRVEEPAISIEIKRFA